MATDGVGIVRTIDGAAGTPNDVPAQFLDQQAFRDWVDASFAEDATTVEKGDGWLAFVSALIPLTGEGSRFGPLLPSPKKSHDGGVDAQTQTSVDGTFLALQAKLTVPDKAAFDGVISKFKNYEDALRASGDLVLFGDDLEVKPVFVLASSNSLTRVKAAYEKSAVSSREFYDQLVEEKRLLIWDGERVLKEVRRLWRQHFGVPAKLTLASRQGWLESGGVYVGLVRGADLAALQEEHGLGIFFENVRDFLGLAPNSDRMTVNQAIVQTARERPDKMLARNNGVVFRASSVTNDGTSLNLQDASIVNGCQTTMCLASVEPAVGPACEILVKVVEANDAWEVAEAANNQNAIAQIDLKLARFLRKQIAEKAAAESGLALKNHSDPEGIASVIASLRRRETSYDQLRYLFLGLFSSNPRHLWDDNYNRLQLAVLEQLYGDGPDGPTELFEVLFLALEATTEALEQCEDLITDDPIKRAHDERKPKYRVYLAILTLCATLKDDLAERSGSVDDEATRMKEFLAKAKVLLENENGRREFVRNYVRAYAIAGEAALEAYEDDSKGKVAQRVITKVAGQSFTGLYKQLRLRMASDERIATL